MLEIEEREYPKLRRGRHASVWAEMLETLERLKVGSNESFFMPLQTKTTNSMRASLYVTVVRRGMRVRTIVETHPVQGVGIRIWRVK